MKKTLFLCLFVFSLLLLILAGGSLKDEKQDVEVQESLAYRPPDIPPASNIFVGLIGFKATSGSDFIQEDQNLIEESPAPALFTIDGSGSDLPVIKENIIRTCWKI